MKYQALRPMYGDYGHRDSGEVFEVPDDPITARKMLKLEQKGLVMRHSAPMAVDRKAYTAYHNKMIVPAENK